MIHTWWYTHDDTDMMIQTWWYTHDDTHMMIHTWWYTHDYTHMMIQTWWYTHDDTHMMIHTWWYRHDDTTTAEWFMCTVVCTIEGFRSCLMYFSWINIIITLQRANIADIDQRSNDPNNTKYSEIVRIKIKKNIVNLNDTKSTKSLK